jgi:nucleoside-diphosphate-sugar epimerase
VIRPGGVYGPHDHTTTTKLVRLLQAERFAYVDGGRAVMAPLYVDNLAALVARAAYDAQAPGEAFNAVDDGHTTWRQYIEWLCEDLGCHAPRRSVPSSLLWPIAGGMEAFGRLARLAASPPLNRYRLRAVACDSHYSTAKARHVLGWHPTIATREGIRRTVAWYRRAMPVAGASCAGLEAPA